MYQQDSPFVAFKPEKVDDSAPRMISVVWDLVHPEVRRSYEDKVRAALEEMN